MTNYDYKSVLHNVSVAYLTQVKRYKIHGKCSIDTDTRYLLKMYLNTRYKILFMYLRYVSRYLYLRYSPALRIPKISRTPYPADHCCSAAT